MRFALAPFTSRLTASAIVALAGFSGVTAAIAEPIPLPSADFEVTARTMGKGTMTLHHSGDKARVEVQMGPIPQITGYMDLKTRKMIMIGAIPGMSKMAVEVGIGDASYGQVIGNGHMIGSDTVAGEPCDLWQMDSAKPGHESAHFGGPVIVCLSQDHIPLRTEATVEGKRKTVSEVTEIRRVRQDPLLFVPPADIQIVKMPKGMGEGIAAGVAKQK